MPAVFSTAAALLSPFTASAERWGVDRRLAYVALAVPVLGILALPVVYVISRDAFGFLMDEDGVVEYLQFVLFLISCVLAGLLARQRWMGGHRAQAIVFAAACLALLFISGEEISWGQRILGFEAPEPIREINEQDEMTLHNISGVLLLFNLGMLVASIYAMVAEPVARRLRATERWGEAGFLFVPPLFLASAFAVTAGFRILRLTLLESGYRVTRMGEWGELCFAAALAIFLVLCWRRLREPAPRG